MTNTAIIANSNKDLYLNLLKHTLTYYLWGETFVPLELMLHKTLSRKILYYALKTLDSLFRIASNGQLGLAKRFRFNPNDRIEGKDWPPLADTMIGLKRLDNIQFCIDDILRNDVPGDIIETGVWRGGRGHFYARRSQSLWCNRSHRLGGRFF